MEYLKRWDQWPLPVLSVREELNPFHADGVDLVVALAYHLPYDNIKFFTVLGMLKGAQESGMLQGVTELVEATSGNTGVVLSLMAREFEVKRVKLVVAPDIPDGKRFPLVMSGADLIPAETGLSAIATARKLGGGGWNARYWHPNNECLNLDQYSNPDGVKLHTDFTGPKILDQLTSPPTVFVMGIGTGGTLVGISHCLKGRLENIKIVGVLLKPGNEIPGVRDLNRMKEIALPWRESLDHYVEVEARPSYLASLWFGWLMGITPGPSSGFAYLGALRFLQERKDAGTLDELRDDHGRIVVVTLFPDGNRPYGDRYMANLPYACLKPATAPMPWSMIGHELW